MTQEVTQKIKAEEEVMLLLKMLKTIENGENNQGSAMHGF